MRDFRIFVSSPGDVVIERRRVDDVVSRLNGELAGLARFTTLRWENAFYRAHETFQTQIPPADECDIVLGILKWRLGTPLPPDFDAKLDGGEPYPSGTAYEILTAVEKRRTGADLPDVFVFRYTASAPHLVIGDPNEALVRREWQALCGFIARWFETPTGQFLAAFNPYVSEDDFEAQLEALLRGWCAEKISSGRASWPASKGSPFRGLDVFDAAHAPVFFGRRDDVLRAVESLRAGAARGTPFLLVLGASGTGKSSLARAGVLPRLTTAGVTEVDHWRTAILRPGDGADPIAALAAALVADAQGPTMGQATGQTAGEPGRALSEIFEGDFSTPESLAVALNTLGAAVRPILRALDRVAARLAEASRTERALRCDLVLLIDQLEELFAPSVSSEARQKFAGLLAGFAASGRVWIVATLRADFYSRLIEEPALKALKEAGGACDLAAPNAAQLADIVRGPASAAGLVFGRDEAGGESSGRSLDERLLEEADRPGMLPLLQLVLTRLWEARVDTGDKTELPWSAYRAMGGVSGIVEEAGERALARLGETERGRLAPLLHRLTERVPAGADGTSVFTGRATAAAGIADAATRDLVDALLGARLLTVSGDGAAAQLRLAHQRVLTDWARARDIIAKDAEFLRIRDETEAQRRRWEAAGRRSELLLARGLPLAEAQSIAKSHADELPRETLAFVAASRRRADRGKLIAWAAAGGFGLLAVAALWQWRVAVRQTEIARQEFAAAKGAVDGLIFDVAQGLRDVEGMRIGTTHKVLDTVKGTVDKLIATAPGDPGLERSRATMFNNFVITYLRVGDAKAALDSASQGVEIVRRLAAQAPSDLGARRDVAIGLAQLGDAKLRSGDQTGALAAYEESLAIDRDLLGRRPGERRAAEDVIIALDRVGDLKQQTGDAAAALAISREALDKARVLVAGRPGDREAQRLVTLNLDRIGDLSFDGSRLAEALGFFDEALALRRKLLEEDPGDNRRLRDISLSLERIARTKAMSGDQVGAARAREEDLGLRRKSVARDETDADARRDLMIALTTTGDAKALVGDSDRAAASYGEAVAIARGLAAKNPGDARGLRDLQVALMKYGSAATLQGKADAARRAFDECVVIARGLYERNPESGEALNDYAQALGASSDAKVAAKDGPAAVTLTTEAVALARRLADRQTSPNARRLVSLQLKKLAVARLLTNDRAGAHAALQESLDIARANAAQNPDDRRNQLDLAAALLGIAGVEPDPRPRYAEIIEVMDKLDAAGGLPTSLHELLVKLKTLTGKSPPR